MKRILVFVQILLILLNDGKAGEKEITPLPLLTIEGLGNGYSTPAITSEMILVTGETGGTGYLFAYDPGGKLLWKTIYGDEWAANFRGSRAAPKVVDSLVYTCSGMGDIACIGLKTGQKKWSVNMIRDLHGVNAAFGYSMPVMVEKERIYCLPGGSDTNIACLNRFSGQIIWISPGDGETPGYTAPIIIRHHGCDLLVTCSELAMLGLDAGTGELFWNYNLSLKGESPCNDPVYSEECIYLVAGSVNGAAKIWISADGKQISRIWKNDDFNTNFGGFVKLGNFLYGSSEGKQKWLSIDAATGLAADSLSFIKGSTFSTGEYLILYSQTGKVGVVRPDHGKMTLVTSFRISKGTHEHFAHPVVAGELLYIRHGDALLVYDFRQLTNL
jgi:outer membrane protein assembly factor BamB